MLQVHLVFGHYPSQFHENIHEVFLKIHNIKLINTTLSVSQMWSLFSRISPAYIHINLKDYLCHLKKCDGTA